MAFSLFAHAPATAQDPRIQSVNYDPDTVYNLTSANDFASVIEILPGETIDSIVLGKQEGWQVSVTAAGDRVVVKPTGYAQPTNLVVISNARRYVFFLNSGGGGEAYVLKFYPSSSSKSELNEQLNLSDYKFSGALKLKPNEISFDGRRTLFVWEKEMPIPAIFAVKSLRNETLLDGQMTTQGYAVEGEHKWLRFRIGKDKLDARTRKFPRR